MTIRNFSTCQPYTGKRFPITVSRSNCSDVSGFGSGAMQNDNFQVINVLGFVFAGDVA